MNTPSNAISESRGGEQVMATATVSEPRAFYWSVRRELWENRSVYVAPLAVAGLALLGFLISTVAGVWERALKLPMQNPDKLVEPYGFATLLIMGTAFIVGLFYCLDALHGERRDRSILFWKSLPVSDATTVLSKASIPIIVLPLFSFAVTVAVQVIMLLLSTVVVLGSGLSVSTLWTHVPLFQMSLMLFYHLLTVHMLWYAPIYAWLLLVSAWARRAVFIWAVLPPIAIGIVEKIAFNTHYFARLMGYRFRGPEAADFTPPHGMGTHLLGHMNLGQFFGTPGLWWGLMVAAIFFAAAIRLRRYRGPI